MPFHPMLIAMATIASAAQDLRAGPVMRAGEWQAVVDGGTPSITCLQADRTAQSSLMALPRIPNVNCVTNNVSTVGPVTSLSQHCTIAASGSITLTGTIHADGPDAFTNTVRSHTEFIGMDTGQRAPIPDKTMTMVLHRLGPCKPGDPLVP